MPGDRSSNAELVYDSRRYKKWLWGWLSYAFASYVQATFLSQSLRDSFLTAKYLLLCL